MAVPNIQMKRLEDLTMYENNPRKNDLAVDIDELGAGMYKGKLVTQYERHLKLSEEQIEKAERKVDMNAEKLCE